jgi:hypothetical protein
LAAYLSLGFRESAEIENFVLNQCILNITQPDIVVFVESPSALQKTLAETVLGEF